jgi:hypothetical protein
MQTLEKTIYQDNFFDKLFINLFSRKIAQALGKNTQLKDYDGFVDLSKQIMQGRNPTEQQELVALVLQSLIPSAVLKMIRTFISPTKLVCELNAWFATLMFEWLVGKSVVKEVEITEADGSKKIQKSGVKIEKCRYLEHSGCVGMCVNMCKLPTQDFFTQKFGIPLTMIPNFEDFSCEMIFGQIPPPLATEAAYHQSCLTTQCVLAKPKAASCPQVRD